MPRAFACLCTLVGCACVTWSLGGAPCWTSSSMRCWDLGLRLGAFGTTLAFALGAWELHVFNGQGLPLSRTLGSCLSLCVCVCVCAMDPWRSPLLDSKLRAMLGSRTSAWGLWHDSCLCLDLGAWELEVFNGQGLSLSFSHSWVVLLCVCNGPLEVPPFALGAWELNAFNSQGLPLSRTLGSCLSVCLCVCVCAMDPWRSPLLDSKLYAMPGSRTSAWGLWHDSCLSFALGAWELHVFNGQGLPLSRILGSCLSLCVRVCAMDPWRSPLLDFKLYAMLGSRTSAWGLRHDSCLCLCLCLRCLGTQRLQRSRPPSVSHSWVVLVSVCVCVCVQWTLGGPPCWTSSSVRCRDLGCRLGACGTTLAFALT